MNETVTITTKSVSEELNKWNLTNYSPLHEMAIGTTNNGIEVFDKPSFEKVLKKASRKTSEPVVETK